MGMTPFSEMPLERFWSLVRIISANFAVIADIQAVQFIQPVWDGLLETEETIWLKQKVTGFTV